jgi:hypothetical protein
MFDHLRDQIAHELGAHRIGVLSAGGELGPHALPVQFRADGLDLLCLLPRWSEVGYTLESSPQVILVVLTAPDSDQRWIRYQGAAERIESPDWSTLLPGAKSPADRFHLIRIHPTRIDLIDERRGFGARETLDI